MATYIRSEAVLTACGIYRYSLIRRWGFNAKAMLIIGLNPSTADSTLDDPTIRRCVGFAKAAGCDSLLMGNLFAFRSKSPGVLKTAPDPIGTENDQWLETLWSQSTVRVAAWGNWGSLHGRGADVAKRFPELQCFGTTANGSPKHPLYLPAASMLVRYSPPRTST